MKEIDRLSPEAFDFSRDAWAFKQKLWKKLKAKAAHNSVRELGDDDLTWVNAAGVPHQAKDDELPE